MPDDLILKDIAQKIEKKRLAKKIKVSELAKMGGFNPQTYSNFINKNADIKLGTLIRILRAFGELDNFEDVFADKVPASLWMKKSKKTPKRVRISYEDTLLSKQKNTASHSEIKRKGAPLSVLLSRFAKQNKDSK